MTESDSGEDQHIRPFAAYLTETNHGRTHRELSEGLHELTHEVLRLGKAGSITLTVKVEPDDVESSRIVVSESVTSKPPKPDPRKSVFWADANGNFTRSDPGQMSFGDLQAAPSPTATTEDPFATEERDAR